MPHSSVADFQARQAIGKRLDPHAAALLVEFGAQNAEELTRKERQVAEALKDVEVLQPLEFITATEAVELAWHVREGLLGIVGKMRPEGSMVITEDVCFPPQRLAQGAHDLQMLHVMRIATGAKKQACEKWTLTA